MANRWTGITVDCQDPARLATFRSALLGRPVSDEHTGPGWATVGSSTGERHAYDEGVVIVMQDPEGHEFCLVQYYG